MTSPPYDDIILPCNPRAAGAGKFFWDLGGVSLVKKKIPVPYGNPCREPFLGGFHAWRACQKGVFCMIFMPEVTNTSYFGAAGAEENFFLVPCVQWPPPGQMPLYCGLFLYTSHF